MIIPFKAASHLNAQVCLLVSSTLPRLQNINIQFFVGHPSHFHFIYPTVSLCSEIKLIDEAQVSNIPKYLTNSFVSTTKKPISQDAIQCQIRFFFLKKKKNLGCKSSSNMTFYQITKSKFVIYAKSCR